MALLGSKHVMEHKLINDSCVGGGICIISYFTLDWNSEFSLRKKRANKLDKTDRKFVRR
jgi:hypothetical protein